MNLIPKLLLLLAFAIGGNSVFYAQTNCLPKIETEESITLCQGDTFVFGTKVISTNGLFHQDFIASNGCDSMVALSVTLLNRSNFSLNETILAGTSYFFKNQYLNSPGTYRDTFSDKFGCDSIITLSLQIITETENCTNGLDDDGDGLIDAFDADCICLLAAERVNIIPNGDFEAKTGCCRAIDTDEKLCVDNWVNLSSTQFTYLHPNCWAVPGQELPREGITLESGFMTGSMYGRGVGKSVTGLSLGICLNQALYAGNTYIMKFDLGRSFNELWTTENNMNLAINGIADCQQMGDYRLNENFCDLNLSYEKLGVVNLTNLNKGWNQIELKLKPRTTIKGIFLGGDCDLKVPVGENHYFFYDNFYLESESGFRLNNEIVVEGNACKKNLNLLIPNISSLSVDWYKDSMLYQQNGEERLTFSPQQLSEINGQFHAKVTFEDGRCQLLGPLDYQLNLTEKNKSIQICEGTSYEFGNQLINKAGVYTEIFSTGLTCDSIVQLTVAMANLANFDLGNDTLLCEGDTLPLSLPFQSEEITWQDESHSSNLTVSESGAYWARVQRGWCAQTDSINVTFINFPFFDLGPDTSLCKGEEITLSRPNIAGNFLWQDDSSKEEQTIEKSGIYWLEWHNQQCSIRDSLEVIFESCDLPSDCQIYLPNIFSPNGDGRNDEFQLYTNCELVTFQLEVFDRWGNLLFTTQEKEKGWDGTFDNKTLDEGVYLVKTIYQFADQLHPDVKINSINIIR